ncbi:hypothetical protein V8E53_003428 [Lactarius tabidus]
MICPAPLRRSSLSSQACASPIFLLFLLRLQGHAIPAIYITYDRSLIRVRVIFSALRSPPTCSVKYSASSVQSTLCRTSQSIEASCIVPCTFSSLADSADARAHNPLRSP